MNRKNIGITGIMLLLLWFVMPMTFAQYQLALSINNEKVMHTQQQSLLITYNNKNIEGDMPALIRDNRSLVPVRSVFESMGAKVSWDSKNQKAQITLKDKNIMLQVNDKVAQVNGKKVTMDVPAQLIGVVGKTDGVRVMVPLRFISENLGQEVAWDPKSYAVRISSKAEEKPVETSLNELSRITHSKEEGYSEVVFETKNKIEDTYEVEILSEGTPRIVVDLKQTKITAKTIPTNIKNDPVSKIRTGQNAAVARVVLELSKLSKYDVKKKDDRHISVRIYYSKILDIQTSYDGNKETAEVSFEEGIQYAVQKDDKNNKFWIDFYGATSDLGFSSKKYADYASLEEIRASKNEGYYRVVFQYAKGSKYEIVKSKDNVKVQFSQGVSSENPVEIPTSPQDPKGPEVPTEQLPQGLKQITYVKAQRPMLFIPKDLANEMNTSTITYIQKLKDKILEITLPNVQLPAQHVTAGDQNIDKIEVKTTGQGSVITIYGKHVYEYQANYNENQDLILTFLRPKEKYKKILVLDPGHGGWDPGAVASGMQEKEINLDAGFMIRDFLKDTDIKIYMTRETDVDLGPKAEDLYNRARLANDIEADLFVSVHHNKFNSNAYGIETFYDPNANKSKPGLTSPKAASIIHNELIRSTGAYNRGVKTAGYVVVKQTQMPSLLVEGGFMDHPQEGAKLKTQEYRTKIAQGISEGIKKIFEQYSTNR